MSKVAIIIEFEKKCSTETKKWLEDKLNKIGLLTTFSANSKNEVSSSEILYSNYHQVFLMKKGNLFKCWR